MINIEKINNEIEIDDMAGIIGISEPTTYEHLNNGTGRKQLIEETRKFYDDFYN